MTQNVKGRPCAVVACAGLQYPEGSSQVKHASMAVKPFQECLFMKSSLCAQLLLTNVQWCRWTDLELRHVVVWLQRQGGRQDNRFCCSVVPRWEIVERRYTMVRTSNNAGTKPLCCCHCCNSCSRSPGRDVTRSQLQRDPTMTNLHRATSDTS